MWRSFSWIIFSFFLHSHDLERKIYISKQLLVDRLTASGSSSVFPKNDFTLDRGRSGDTRVGLRAVNERAYPKNPRASPRATDQSLTRPVLRVPSNAGNPYHRGTIGSSSLGLLAPYDTRWKNGSCHILFMLHIWSHIDRTMLRAWSRNAPVSMLFILL